jgi:hypothetical protein
LGTVADGGDGFVGAGEVLDGGDHLGVEAQVFRGAATGDDAVRRRSDVNFIEGRIQREVVAGLFE